MRRGIAMRHPWYQDVTGGQDRQKPRSGAKLRCNARGTGRTATASEFARYHGP